MTGTKHMKKHLSFKKHRFPGSPRIFWIRISMAFHCFSNVNAYWFLSSSKWCRWSVAHKILEMRGQLDQWWRIVAKLLWAFWGLVIQSFFSSYAQAGPPDLCWPTMESMSWLFLLIRSPGWGLHLQLCSWCASTKWEKQNSAGGSSSAHASSEPPYYLSTD